LKVFTNNSDNSRNNAPEVLLFVDISSLVDVNLHLILASGLVFQAFVIKLLRSFLLPSVFHAPNISSCLCL